MRVVFFGTSSFAVPPLRRLASKHIVAVVTQPQRPRGRSRRPEPSPVETAARELELKVLTPSDPNSAEFQAELSVLRPELGVLVSYGCILREPLLELPDRGFINLHPSLLPAYRGAAPIQRALMHGCCETGLTVIAMTREVDAGDILSQSRVAVSPEETAGELAERLAHGGAELLVKTLDELAQGRVRALPQDSSKATPAPKIDDAERLINWTRPAEELHNLIRALSPSPAAYTFFRSKRVLVLRSRPEPQLSFGPAGTIITDLPGLAVATGAGTLTLMEVRPEAGKTQTGKDFRNGYRPVPGERFADS